MFLQLLRIEQRGSKQNHSHQFILKETKMKSFKGYLKEDAPAWQSSTSEKIFEVLKSSIC